MRKAARRSSRNSVSGSEPARISPKASPRSAKSAGRIIPEGSAGRPPPNPPPLAGEGWVGAMRSGAVVREDDRRHEGPGFDEGGLVGLAAERFHGAKEAEP